MRARVSEKPEDMVQVLSLGEERLVLTAYVVVRSLALVSFVVLGFAR